MARSARFCNSALDDRLYLQWNDFKDNVSSAFGSLRDDKEFTDVTLVCEDGQQVEAHKLVLIVSSPFFQNILQKNKHPHPLIYIRGVRYEDLSAMVDFIYRGEANDFQGNLDFFLTFAGELQMKGLKGNESDADTLPEKQRSKLINSNPQKMSIQNAQ